MGRRAVIAIGVVLGLGATARPSAAQDPCLLFAETATCTPGRFALGVGLFAPGGVTVEAVPHRFVVVDAAFGRDHFVERRWTATAAVTVPVKTFNYQMLLVPIYLGAGAAWIDHDGRDDSVVVRLPAGVRAQSVLVSFQMFVEAALRISTDDQVDTGVEASVGFRYFLR